MKKFAVFVVIAALLLAGCTTQVPVPVETLPAEIPDIDTIIQQSVDEAMAPYEEEQRAKDAEIEELKAQLEALTSQKEEASAEHVPEDAAPQPESAPAEEAVPENEPAPLAETSTEPGSEPPPPSEPAPPKSNPSSSGSGQGFDFKNLYPDYVWESLEEAEEESYTASQLTEEAEEAIGPISYWIVTTISAQPATKQKTETTTG